MWKRMAALLLVGLSLPALAAVKRFELTAHSSVFPVDQGVYVKGFSFNETSPGPLMVVEEGDTVEIVLRNEDFVAHGLSIHAANTRTSKFLGNVQPGEERVFRFQADFPGVFMYHCAPGEPRHHGPHHGWAARDDRGGTQEEVPPRGRAGPGP